jgi:hypothetical protein
MFCENYFIVILNVIHSTEQFRQSDRTEKSGFYLGSFFAGRL